MPTMTDPASAEEPPRVFPNTRWSIVLTARKQSPESAAALEAVCRAYWHPLYCYARRNGHAPHDAQDLTQEFFQHLLQKRWLDDADREKGRLRTFLIVAMKRFLGKERRRAQAQRRGGGQAGVSFDTSLAESRLASDSQTLTPDEAFDREWAVTLLELAISRLRAEFAKAGRDDNFDVLKGCLLADRGGIDHAALALQLGVNEGAARVAVHRLRKRFREIFREEISQTLADSTEVDVELRHLAAVLGRRQG